MDTPASVLLLAALIAAVPGSAGVWISYQGVKAARRAEARAMESTALSAANALALSKVATAKQLDGQLTLFRELVRKEAEGRIAAAERRAEQQFMAGQEAERTEPIATASAVATLQTTVEDAATASAKRSSEAATKGASVTPARLP